jgi:hypothetical protein
MLLSTQKSLFKTPGDNMKISGTQKSIAFCSTLLSLALAGCGGGGNTQLADASTPASTPTTPATPAPTTPASTTTPTTAVPIANSFDEYYNVCRGTNPICYNDWNAFATTPNRVLIYSRTAGPRHANLGTPMAAGLNPVMNADNVMQAGLKRTGPRM